MMRREVVLASESRKALLPLHVCRGAEMMAGCLMSLVALTASRTRCLPWNTWSRFVGATNARCICFSRGYPN